MPKCPNCGHDAEPRPSLTEMQARRIMTSLEYVARITQEDQLEVNAALLDRIRELWDENRALKAQVAALEAERTP